MNDTPRTDYGARRGKVDLCESHREEIQHRTNNGESCIQIEEALQARGIKISSKTISRRRIEWGMRRRAVKTGCEPMEARSGPRKTRALGEVVSLVGTNNRDYRREEILMLTNDGKTAEEITARLAEQGVTFQRGVDTVRRLQTRWGFVACDRICNKKKKSKKTPKANGENLRAQEPESAATATDATLHYPVNCSFGPIKKNAAAQRAEPQMQSAQTISANATDGPIQIDPDLDSDSDGGAEPLSMFDGYQSPSASSSMTPSAPPHTGQQSQAYPTTRTAQNGDRTTRHPMQMPFTQTVAQTRDMMSAELLVDLATSTLAAANRHRELLLAAQLRRPAPGSVDALPPIAEDIATARRKFVEAARVAIDLALDEPS